MDQVRAGSISISWYAECRLAVLCYEAPVSATGKDLRPLLEALTRWVGTEGQTFFLLNDCGPLISMDTEYRAGWRTFFRPHRDASWCALYNLSPVIQIVAEMFRVATGLHIGVFKTETAARSWLQQKGCPP
ncbi:MAG TPA: hypothetical protein VGL19_12485 [Polyangiaceae bacterium]